MKKASSTSKKNNKKQAVTVEEMLSLLPSELIDKIAAETAVDYKVHKLTGRVLFCLLLYGLIKSERLSLRLLELYYNSEAFSQSFKEKEHQTLHSSLADRLKTVNKAFFASLFEHTRNVLHASLGEGLPQPMQKIKILDSTYIAFSAKLLKEGLAIGKKPKNKSQTLQLKVTVITDGALPSQLFVHDQPRYHSEDIALGEALSHVQADSSHILIFDRGVSDRRIFDAIEERGHFFITRLKTDSVYEMLSTHSQVKGKETQSLVLEKDIRVHLYGNTYKSKHPYRLIQARSKEKEEILFFLTNIDSLAAAEITDLYKKRWQIEMLFKMLKQTMNMKQVLGYSRNTIEVVLYMQMIAFMLIHIFRKKNTISSFKIAKVLFEEQLWMLLLKDLVVKYQNDLGKLTQLLDMKMIV